MWVLSVPTSLAVLLATSGISFGAEPTQEKTVSSTPEKAVHFLPQLSAGDERFWIVLALIVLMGGLFVVLFWWQKKIEQSGYFANIYRTTVENIETARLSGPLNEKWAQGAYLSEIYLQHTTRGKEWAEKNQRPEPTRDLWELASTLGLESEIRAIEWSLHTPLRVPLTEGGGVNPFSGGNWLPGRTSSGIAPRGHSRWEATGATVRSEQIDKEAYQKSQKFWSLLNDFRDKGDDWVNRAVARAWSWYQTELEGIKGTARKQAQRALSVDYSALRGRGPEFVLEFTAIVVVIFAAVILGLWGLLGDQQIGTLLAAIAGYVLGKSVARSGLSQAEEQAPPRSDRLEVSVTTPKEGTEPDKHVSAKHTGGEKKANV